ncbi:DUF1385 domain-containing protein, partial [Candidatus Woesearchaeota archaeon]|nr:DUF1385 domain-containing protein [Candidatus Woesearchaeota archaeon]
KHKLKRKSKIFKTPFIRGFFVLVDTLVLGIKALSWSANQQLEKKEKITMKEMILTIAASFIFAVLFFIVIPFYLTGLIVNKGILFNLIDGILRIGIFFIYLLAISLMKDVKLLFKYHGAEHKAVNCFEAKKALTIKNAKKFTTVNPRCGTSFLVIVLAISILIFSLIISDYWYIRLGARIILIPVIAAVYYEILKLSSKFKNNLIFKILNTPGLWIQKITTKEPTNKQIEVAIASLKAVLK